MSEIKTRVVSGRARSLPDFNRLERLIQQDPSIEVSSSMRDINYSPPVNGGFVGLNFQFYFTKPIELELFLTHARAVPDAEEMVETIHACETRFNPMTFDIHRS